MRITGVLIWADEQPLWLTAAVASIAPVLDHLVALDGKYLLYPGALEQPASNVEQSMAILEAASACNLGLTLYRPNMPFMENEIEKRNLSFALAETVTEEEDWFLVFDADNIARKCDPVYLRKDLAGTDCLVAEYAVYEKPEYEGYTNVRGLYRAIRGMKYGPAHWNIRLPSGSWLWGNPNIQQPYERAFDVTHALKFDHRNRTRDEDRRKKADAYYAQRDLLGLELITKG